MKSIKETILRYTGNRLVDLILPIVIGFICGLVAIIIRFIVQSTFSWVMNIVNISKHLDILTITVFLIIGTYITALLANRMKEASGVGLDVSIRNYHNNAGIMPVKFAPLKFLATIFTLGLGGSGGLVGPTASIGHGISSYFSKGFKLSEDESKMLALCGIAGCVSGLLHTPFGATIFGLELCYLDGIIYTGLIPVLASSMSAYIVSFQVIAILPLGKLLYQPYSYRIIDFEPEFPWNLNYLGCCILVALVTTALGIAFIKLFQALQTFSDKRFSTIKYRPIIGALFVGLISVLFFRNNLADVLGEPSNLVEHCAEEGYPLHIAFILLVGRWINTFLTVGLGGSGGLFSPIMLLGGLSGNIVSKILGIQNTKILVSTGMATALSAVINVPIAAIVIIVEIFGVGYIIPAAIGSSIAFMIARNFVIYPHVKRIKQPINLL